MKTVQYDRIKAVEYAKKWAYGRNPRYYDFNNIGGDCTNYASQCLFAGSGVMNETPVFGWFYKNVNDRTASWTGVEYFYQFLINNHGIGPQATVVASEKLQLGDFVQFGNATEDFYHTPVVTGFSSRGILVSAHTYDVYNKPLTEYAFARIRGIHIDRIRIE